ncbi:hypothetical protein FDECE_15605 [Fusarium decemcellulare]|nr:hypothetical protein FDECE_15605 [Fusarium decemcellulare]
MMVLESDPMLGATSAASNSMDSWEQDCEGLGNQDDRDPQQPDLWDHRAFDVNLPGLDGLATRKCQSLEQASASDPKPAPQRATRKPIPVSSPSPPASSETLSPNTTSSNTLSPSAISPSLTPLVTPPSVTVSPGTLVGDSPPGGDISIQVVEYDPRPARRGSTAKKSRDRNRAQPMRANVMKREKEPKTSVKRGPSGNVVGMTTVFGLSQCVRARPNSQKRQKTTYTKEVGACQRCREQKIRPCNACLKHVVKFYWDRAHKFQCQPVIRVDILDLRLHRKGPTIRNDLCEWVTEKQRLLRYNHTNDRHVLFLTQGFGEAWEDSLCVTVSRFDPVPGDRTTYFWTDPAGNPREMEVPPYFISDLDEARCNIRQFVYDVRSTYIEALHQDSSPLIRQTFQAALNYAAFNKTELVSVALNTWVAARLIEDQWRVFNGGALIGIEPTNEPGHPWNGFSPVTPIMDSQLDDLVIRDLLEPLSAEFLQKLKAKIDERKPENWLEIYLALFIMMSNAGMTTKDMKVNAAWKGLKAGSRGGTLTQGFMHACKTMLAYFHFACAGSYPLTITFDKPSGSSPGPHGITAEQIEWRLADESRTDKIQNWESLSMYDDDGYWCYQLLSRQWRGDIRHNGAIDDYTEEDFLSSSTT